MIAVAAPADSPEAARQRVADALVAASVSAPHMAAVLVAVEMLQKASYVAGKREGSQRPYEHA